YVLFVLYSTADHRYLHSFPTRRSSDLTSTTGRASASDDRGTASPDCFPVSMPLPPSAASRPGGRQGLEVSSRRPSAAALCISKPDRKSTRLNSSHVAISYAVFCLKKKS